MAKGRGFFSRILPSRGDGDSNGAAKNIEKVFAEDLVHSVFQPLVDLETHRAFAYEALARCSFEEYRAPPVLFEAAVKAGRVGELGHRLRQQAVDICTDYPLFLNVHPHEFSEGWLVRPDDPIFWHNEEVFLEITESVPLHYYDHCHGVLAEARSKGVKLAVDDLGSGFSNLKYISDLEPAIVKIDIQLIAGLTIGTRLFRLVRSIVRLCEDMGAKVVAEGIETESELEAVIETGAHYGQGYLLARPAFPPPIPVWPGESASNDDE